LTIAKGYGHDLAFSSFSYLVRGGFVYQCKTFSSLPVGANEKGRLEFMRQEEQFMNVTKIVRTTSLLALASLLTVCGSASLYGQGQASTATLSGSVRDASGAVVPGAKLVLSNPERGFTQTFTSEPDGRYVFSLLPPGTYSLRVEKNGFRPYVQSGIVLTLGQTATQDVALQVGTARQTVTVTAGAEILNTTTANVGTTVTQQQVLELPLNVRNIFNMIYVNASVNHSSQFQVVNAPGQSDTADQDAYFMNFGGGRFGTTAVVVDGDWDVGGDWGGYMYVPSVDNTQEFSVQTNSFSAQYGWSTGNVINLVTKSGTRSFHGDAYEFNRNTVFDATNFFNNLNGVPRTPIDRNDFGVAAGGPLYIPGIYKQRDKTFIFGEFEGLRQDLPGTVIDTVPTVEMRGGNFSQLLGPATGTDCLGRPILSGQIYNPFTTRTITKGQIDPTTGLMGTCSGYVRDPFSGNIIPPNMLNSVANNMVKYWPNPTSSALVNNYIYSAASPSKWDGYSFRVDQNISDKSRLFVRWSQKFEWKTIAADTFGTTDPGGGGGLATDNRWSSAVGYTHTFSPTTVMSLNVGLDRWAEGNVMQAYPFAPSTLGLPSFLDTYSNEFPDVSVSGIAGLGPGSVSGGAGQGVFPRNTWSYSADFTKVLGPHTLNFGFMGVGQQSNGGRLYVTSFNFGQDMTQGPNPTAALPNTGYGFSSFLLGAGDSGSTGINTFGFYSRTMYGWYLQDNWKARRNLTLNLGLRYDFQPGPTEKHNETQWFNFTAANPISKNIDTTVPGELVFTNSSNPHVFNAQYDNFAPRIGLAYQTTKKLVMRAGFGIFDTQSFQLGPPNNGYSSTAPWDATVNGITPVLPLSNPFPSGMVFPTGRSLGGLTYVGQGITAVQHYFPSPYVEQWMYGLQYALTPNDMIDVTYLGNHGVKLPFGSVQMDQLPVKYMPMGDALLADVPNPFYPYITSSSCGLNDPTVPAGQLLRPYPEYCGVGNDQMPGSFSNYNAAEINFRHRWAQALELNVSYTVSKYIDDSAGTGDWANIGSDEIRNNYDYYAEKGLDGDDIPQSLVVNYIYRLPVGTGRRFLPNLKGVGNAVLGGWQASGITTYKSGFPLSITAATNNTNSFGGNQRPNLVANPHVSNPNIYEWFNVNAFSQPAPFTFGNVPRYMPNLRAPGYKDWDLAIEKSWYWRERYRLQFRAEMYNAFNQVDFYAPNQNFGSPGFGTITAAYDPRVVQFALKAYW
jgi:hypothetical protein